MILLLTIEVNKDDFIVIVIYWKSRWLELLAMEKSLELLVTGLENHFTILNWRFFFFQLHFKG
jgi:hypothetical protein